MTAFEYMASLGRPTTESAVSYVKDLSFTRVGSLTFATFTVESDISPLRDRTYIITETLTGEAFDCDVPYSMQAQAQLLVEPERLLALPRRLAMVEVNPCPDHVDQELP